MNAATSKKSLRKIMIEANYNIGNKKKVILPIKTSKFNGYFIPVDCVFDSIDSPLTVRASNCACMFERVYRIRML